MKKPGLIRESRSTCSAYKFSYREVGKAVMTLSIDLIIRQLKCIKHDVIEVQFIKSFDTPNSVLFLRLNECLVTVRDSSFFVFVLSNNRLNNKLSRDAGT